MVNFWAESIILECLKIDKPLGKVNMHQGDNVHGGVKELINTMNLALVKLMMKKGLNVYAYDELFSRDEIEKMGLRFIEPKDADMVFDCFKLVIK